jgi:mRNA interferase MazF
MTMKRKLSSGRIPIHFECKDGRIVLDQIRTVDKMRLVEKLGIIDVGEQKLF